jgi:hypothetical protein
LATKKVVGTRVKPPLLDDDGQDWYYDFIFGTTMLNSLKESDMKKGHRDQIEEAGFLAACTDNAVNQMNDRITGILALNAPEDIKTAYEKAANEPPRRRVPAGRGRGKR